MKKSIQVQLAEALGELDQIRVHLSSLARAAGDGTAAPAGQTSVMKTEYENRLRSLEQTVNSLKSGFNRQINQLRITLEAYNDQIEQLKTHAASGVLTPRRFKRQLEKLSSGKAESEEKLSTLEVLSSAQSAADLRDVVPPPPPVMYAGGGQHVSGDVVLRSAGAALAAVLLVSTFMPLVSTAGLLKVSLFQVGRLAQATGDGRGVLLWLTPLLFAAIAGISSMLRDRSARGGILLAIGVLSLAPLALAVTFGLFHPGGGGGDELVGLIASAAQPEIGAFGLLGAFAGMYILGGINLRDSDIGKRWCVATTFCLILVCVATTVYCVVVVNAKPSLTLSIANQGLFDSSLGIDVYNGGNLPLILRRDMAGATKRNEFVLKMQKRGTDEGWSDVESGLGTGLLDLETAVVAPNMSRTVLWSPRSATGATAFRAVLVNSGGRVVASGAVSPTRSLQTANSRTDSTDGQPGDNTALARARQEVDDIEAQSNTMSADMLPHEIAGARSAIDDVEVKAENKMELDSLHNRVDKVILDVRDREAESIFKTALDYRDRKLDEMAIGKCSDVVGVYQKSPRPRMLSGDPEMVKKARDMIRQIQMRRDPEARFEVRGIMKQGDSAVAMLIDKLDDTTRSARKGEKIDEFRVETVDPARGIVVLRRGQYKYELHSP
jgi:hypothetical protein